VVHKIEDDGNNRSLFSPRTPRNGGPRTKKRRVKILLRVSIQQELPRQEVLLRWLKRNIQQELPRQEGPLGWLKRN
jgi:hypothetical protein